ncbi:large ribosomal subunit protein mL42-like [Tubulanus polymorphus]|uniref:large ribosomal subunit protein mL42-like n=1 Tax=Tubulanus polymorphus TaxID=672921 RepID=UPI003DA567DA
MAAPMMRTATSKLRTILPQTLSVCNRFSQSKFYLGAPVDKTFPNPAIVLSKDGATVVCWHPEEEFPYELTKPLPRSVPEMEEGDSLLKVQYLEKDKFEGKPMEVVNRELAEMFYTSRHPWDIKPQKKRIKPNPPKDRESI